MIIESPLLAGILSAVTGTAAGYAAVRTTASFAAAVIFLAAMGKSGVPARSLKGGLSLGLVRAALFSILFYAAWRSLIWFDLFRADENGFIAFVGAVAGLAAASRGVGLTIELARASAWEPGFAEELAAMPLARRKEFLTYWR